MARIERLVFFGSPPFALPALRRLHESAYEPMFVVSQPARRQGRGRVERDPAVAAWAKERGIETWQPASVRRDGFSDKLRQRQPDLGVVVAFGQIFPADLLTVPALGCVNLHASLLPRHRGAAPIQAALAAGDEHTGVTTMQMDAGMDTGDILEQRRVDIEPEDDAPSLSERLAVVGAELLLHSIEGLAAGAIRPSPQDHAAATYAPRLQRSDGRVEWSTDAELIERRMRAFRPWPGSIARLGDETIKVLDARVLATEGRAADPGTFLGLQGGALAVACGRGVLGVTRLQRPGRSAVGAEAFARGYDLEAGEVLFSEVSAEDA